MQKLTITIALAVIALALGTATITTTMQIRPAYSQASHCRTGSVTMGVNVCITPGKDSSVSLCFADVCDRIPISQQEAGQRIGSSHRACAQGLGECTVTHP